MRNKPLALAVLFAATAFIAAGCGGDSSSDSEDAPTKTAYIEQADGLCSDSVSEINKISADLPNDIESPEVQTAITDEVLPIYQDELEQLRELTPPEGDEDATAAIYDAVDEALQAVEDDPSAIASEDTFSDANQQAQDYGLKVCGS